MDRLVRGLDGLVSAGLYGLWMDLVVGQDFMYNVYCI